MRSDDDVEVFESARERWVSNLSSSFRTFEGRVGERRVGNPWGLLSGSSTGDNSGGRPCGVELDGPDLSIFIFDSAGSGFGGRAGRAACLPSRSRFSGFSGGFFSGL